MFVSSTVVVSNYLSIRVSTYDDFIVGINNFSGEFYIVRYHWIWLGSGDLAPQCSNVRSVDFSAMMVSSKITGQLILILDWINLLKSFW